MVLRGHFLQVPTVCSLPLHGAPFCCLYGPGRPPLPYVLNYGPLLLWQVKSHTLATSLTSRTLDCRSRTRPSQLPPARMSPMWGTKRLAPPWLRSRQRASMRGVQLGPSSFFVIWYECDQALFVGTVVRTSARLLPRGPCAPRARMPHCLTTEPHSHCKLP